ncbi:MAG: heavy-metal-associated domain-containing protein [Gemmatimonadota bacterium]
MKAIRTAAALVLAIGLAAPQLAAQQEAAAPEPEPRQIQVTILGMSCPFCAYGVEQKLKKLEGVEEIEVVLETGLATLTMVEDADLSNELLQKTVKEAGFEAAKIVRNFESEFPDFDGKTTG